MQDYSFNLQESDKPEYKMLEFIPSVTMRKYLKEKLDSKEFAPSVEDIAATVFSGEGDIFQKAEFYKQLLKEDISDNTRRELVSYIEMSEHVSKYIENKDLRYSFVCGNEWEKRRAVYNSFKKAVKFLRRNNSCYAAIMDKHISAKNKFVAEIIMDDNRRSIIQANEYRNEHWSYPKGSIADRYVKYPVPFKVGDIVYNTYSMKRELFCVIDAEQPDYNELLDNIDASILVIPYEYKEYASPEKIKEHYDRLKNRKQQGEYFCDGEPDVISREHEHLSVLYTELWKEDKA